jgi:hypothetical protein
MQYTRQDLITICERAIVPLAKWSNRDTPQSQKDVGKVWALLKAGCPFTIIREEDSPGVVTDETIIWLEIRSPHTEIYYLPTLAKIERSSGEDWY